MKKVHKYADVINFSGGRTSAYMTKRLIDERGADNFIILFQNTGREVQETLDFINECDKRWGLNIVWLEYRPNNEFAVVDYNTASRNGEPFTYAVQHQKNRLPNVFKRYCTKMLKLDTARRYLKSIGITEWTNYNGIRYDEPRRWSKVTALPNYLEVEMPLVKWKITKQDVLDWWDKQEFNLNLNSTVYGNCDGCFLKGVGNLLKIAQEKPELFEFWINLEKNSEFTFTNRHSYEELMKRAKSASLDMFDTNNIECFCNVD